MKNFILKIINDVEDKTEQFSKEEIDEGKDAAILCYIFPVIPYFLNKKNLFVKYHSIIGMNLFIIDIFYYIFFRMIKSLELNITIIDLILSIVWLILLILACIGISNVCDGKARCLPLINKIKIFK